MGGTNSTGKRAVLPPDYQQHNTNIRFHAAHSMAAENISAKKVVSIRALSRMSSFSQESFEIPQFTNPDNSIDIADRIGELYVVDSYYVYVDFRSCCGRCELKYDPLVHKLMPVRFT